MYAKLTGIKLSGNLELNRKLRDKDFCKDVFDGADSSLIVIFEYTENNYQNLVNEIKSHKPDKYLELIREVY